jgi:hypothetical protein
MVNVYGYFLGESKNKKEKCHLQLLIDKYIEHAMFDIYIRFRSPLNTAPN